MENFRKLKYHITVTKQRFLPITKSGTVATGSLDMEQGSRELVTAAAHGMKGSEFENAAGGAVVTLLYIYHDREMRVRDLGICLPGGLRFLARQDSRVGRWAPLEGRGSVQMNSADSDVARQSVKTKSVGQAMQSARRAANELMAGH